MPELSEVRVGSTRPVLVVDDDPVVANGRLAVERATRQPPDLVVLDTSLPWLGGADVAAEVRAKFGERLPILVITAYGRPAERARRLGAYAYLSKPFDGDELVAMVYRALGST